MTLPLFARRPARVAAAWLLIASSLLAGCDNTTPEQHLTSAQQAYDQGEYRTAVIELKNALQKDAQLIDARVLLGESYLRLGDYPSALKEFERALDLGNQAERVQLGLHRAQLGLGRNQEVIGALEAMDSRSQALDLLLADAYLNTGAFDAAEPLYRRGESQAGGLSGLAAIAWQRGDLVTAVSLFERSVAGSVDDFQVWQRKAEFELAQNDLDAAAASFREVSEMPAGRVFGRIGTVRVLLAAGDVDGAGTAIDSVLEVAPDYPLARYLEGLIRYQQRDFDRSEAALLEVQRRFPDHEPTLYLMGLVKFQLGQLAQAEYNITRFVAAQPDNESARKLLASVSMQQSKLDEAIEALEPVAGSTSDPQLLAMLGTAYTQAGRAAEASDVLTRAVDLNPDGASFRNQLALSLLSAGKEDLARSELNAAVEVDGNQIQSEYLMAMLELRDGDIDKARELINAIVRKSPDNPIGPNLLGAAALTDGDQDAAIGHFRRALELDPGFIPAMNNLSRLLEERGDVDAAEALYRDRAKAVPDDLAVQLGLTDLLVRNGKVGEAVTAARNAVAADPTSLRAQVALVRLYRLTGDPEEAEATVDSALAQQVDSPDLKLLKAELSLARGDAAAARGPVNELQALFSRDDQPNPQLALVLGRLQAQLGNIVVARSNYEAAANALGKDNSQALVELGRLNLVDRQFDAVEDQLKALDGELDDRSATARSLLEADLAAARGQTDAAKALYEPLRQAGNRDATLRLAQLALQENRGSDGIALLAEQVNRNPNDQGARLLLSGALLANDQKDEAISEYEKLVETGNPVVLNNLAWLYMERGDKRALELGARGL